MPTQDPRTIPSFSTRLWSEEVGLASGGGPDEELVQYEFSNGEKFTRRYPYDPPVFNDELPEDAP